MPDSLPMTPRPRVPAPQEGRCQICGTASTTMADSHLCVACHGPGRPTHRQQGEIARMQARHGDVKVSAAVQGGWLVVQLRIAKGTRTYAMDPEGRLH